MGTVVAHFKAQDSKIQKMSDQVKMRNSALQMVPNDQ